jgi:hypothetical protein
MKSPIDIDMSIANIGAWQPPLCGAAALPASAGVPVPIRPHLAAKEIS